MDIVYCPSYASLRLLEHSGLRNAKIYTYSVSIKDYCLSKNISVVLLRSKRLVNPVILFFNFAVEFISSRRLHFYFGFNAHDKPGLLAIAWLDLFLKEISFIPCDPERSLASLDRNALFRTKTSFYIRDFFWKLLSFNRVRLMRGDYGVVAPAFSRKFLRARQVNFTQHQDQKLSARESRAEPNILLLAPGAGVPGLNYSRFYRVYSDLSNDRRFRVFLKNHPTRPDDPNRYIAAKFYELDTNTPAELHIASGEFDICVGIRSIALLRASEYDVPALSISRLCIDDVSQYNRYIENTRLFCQIESIMEADDRPIGDQVISMVDYTRQADVFKLIDGRAP